ncbi:MAG: NAD(P)/FAD-dependent oxidoreductase [Granulosicoccus sp.]
MQHCDVAIVGSGIVGIATAYYLKTLNPQISVILIDAGPPMALTSAQSGENYRNWWPHPVMTAFTDHSIDLMESLARESNDSFNMNRRGYVLSTRADDVDTLMSELEHGYSQLSHNDIRIHDTASGSHYIKPVNANWEHAPSGVDVLKNQELIKATFPSYDPAIKTIVHIRRAGAISAQQMGQLMLSRFKLAGGQRVSASVVGIEVPGDFIVRTDHPDRNIRAEKIINAAGPFINDIARMLGTQLPVSNTLQQKIAFEDTLGAIPRQMPFSIDLDAQEIDWEVEERQLLAESEDHRWLTAELPGAIHCRPDGGDNGNWVKLGWAFNDVSVAPVRDPELMESFPEIVLHGAARLNPALKSYYGSLPRAMHHYGGYYTLTDENWPLVGAMDTVGSYVVGAMSGFGTMAACAAGDLCARVVLAKDIPDYAHSLSPQRYSDSALMAEIRALSQRGIL